MYEEPRVSFYKMTFFFLNKNMPCAPPLTGKSIFLNLFEKWYRVGQKYRQHFVFSITYNANDIRVHSFFKVIIIWNTIISFRCWSLLKKNNINLKNLLALVILFQKFLTQCAVKDFYDLQREFPSSPLPRKWNGRNSKIRWLLLSKNFKIWILLLRLNFNL